MLSESRIEYPPIAFSGATGAAVAATLRTGLALTLLAQLAACSPVGMAVGAGATVANMAMEERCLVNAVRDNVIWIDLNGRLLHKDPKLFQNVNLQVQEDRVLLTNSALKPEDRVEAPRIAWEPHGLRDVINNVKL